MPRIDLLYSAYIQLLRPPRHTALLVLQAFSAVSTPIRHRHLHRHRQPGCTSPECPSIAAVKQCQWVTYLTSSANCSENLHPCLLYPRFCLSPYRRLFTIVSTYLPTIRNVIGTHISKPKADTKTTP